MMKKKLRRVSLSALIFLLLSSYIPALQGGGNTAVQAAEGDKAEYVRIKNQYRGTYLLADGDKVAYGAPVETDRASQWFIEEHDGKQMIKNRETGLYMSLEGWTSHESPIRLAAASSDAAALWKIVNAVTEGFKSIQPSTNPNHYIHIEDKTGFAQASSIPPNWGTAQWSFEPVVDYVRFKNKHTGEYLFAAEGILKYGKPAEADPSSHFAVENKDGNQQIKNRASNAYVSAVESTYYYSPVTLIPADEELVDVDWKILDANEAGYVNIEHAATTSEGAYRYLHVQEEAGKTDAQLSTIDKTWGTPKWAVEPVTVKTVYNPNPDNSPKYIQIKNDWLGLYMYEDDGVVKYGNVLADNKLGQWLIVEEEGMQRIQNRATGNYISLKDVSSDKISVKTVKATESAVTEQWVIDNLNSSGSKLIHPASDEGSFLHVEKKRGFVQFGAVPRDWGSPKWTFVPVAKEAAPKYIQLKNSYTNKLLYEDEQKVKYGDPDSLNAASHWLIEDAGNGLKRVKNRLTGHYLHVEGMQADTNPHLLPLNSGTIEESWTSAKWSVTVTEDNKLVFTNGYKTDQVIHVQDATGYAQSSNIPAEWGSAQWIAIEAQPLLPSEIPTDYIRLKNADNSSYLYENEFGVILYGTPNARDARSHWMLLSNTSSVIGEVTIINRATNHKITIAKEEAYLVSRAGMLGSNGEQTWFLERNLVNGKFLLRSKSQPVDYMHIQDRTGYAQVGLRSIESAALQWELETASKDSFVPEPEAPSELVHTTRLNDSRSFQLLSAGSDVRLAINGNELVVLPASSGSSESNWRLQDEDGYKLIYNEAADRYLAVKDGQLIVSENTGKAEASSQWKMIDRSGLISFENVEAKGMLLQISGNAAGLSSGTLNAPKDEQQLRMALLKSNVTLEAEDAFLSGGVQAGADAKGFSGDGYAGDFSALNASVTFTVFAEEAGTYDASIRYANANGSAKVLAAAVNGLNEQQLAFTAAGSWDTWQKHEFKLTLRAGLNTVTLSNNKGDVGQILLDQLVVNNVLPLASRGASTAYSQYEAEHAATNAVIIEPTRAYRALASEASGRQAVRLEEAGDYVEFKLQKAANRLTLRYSIPDSEDGMGNQSSIGLYVNGVKQEAGLLTSKYSWVYGSYPWTNQPSDGDAHRFFDETSFIIADAAAGSTIRVQKEADSAADHIVIDLVEAELADAAYSMPDGFVSVTEFGATANDGTDDSNAIREAIEAAKLSGKGVWLPAGAFRIDQGPIELADITIRGAGKWQTTLVGGGFMGVGNHIRVYDLAIDGEVTSRRDDQPESAFDGTYGIGSTLQHIRVDHVKTGIWVTEKELAGGATLATDGLYVAGLQIRNTFADGINFSTGTSNSMAEQTQLRNTGDDSLAMWANGKQSVGNTFRFNTAELPWLSNNIAVYGGKDVTISDNIVSDTVAFGAGISVSTRHNPVPFEGDVIVERNTLLRTGGREHNWPADFGGLFLFSGDTDMTGNIQVRDNIISDSTFQGISLLGEKYTSGIVLENNVVDGAGTWGIQASGNIKGSAVFGDTLVRGVKVGAFMNGASDFAFETTNEAFSFTHHAFSVAAGEQRQAPYLVEAGQSIQLTAFANGTEAEAEAVIWAVKDSAVAEISSSGVLTGIGQGETQLKAVYGDAIRTYTVKVADDIAPNWPAEAALSAAQGENGSAALKWPLAMDNGQIAAYRLSWDTGFKIVPSTETATQVSGLSAGRSYRFVLEARDQAGNWTENALMADLNAPSTPPDGAVTPQPSESLKWIETVKKQEDGKTFAELTFQKEDLQAALKRAAANHNSVLSLVLATKETAADIVLPVSVLKEAAAAQPETIIEISIYNAVYELNISAIRHLLSDDPNAQLRLRMKKLDSAASQLLTEHTGIKPIGEVYAFELMLETGGKVQTIHSFANHYVKRSIILPAASMTEFATGVVYDEAGKRWKHVPTLFKAMSNGKIEAVISSLSNSIYTVINEKKTFLDMKGHWAEKEVTKLASQQMIKGMTESEFAPGQKVTRAEFAVMLTEAFGLSASSLKPFKDTKADAWYSDAIASAYEAGFIKGFDNMMFRPSESISREQMIVMLMRAYRLANPQIKQADFNLNAFSDAKYASAWAVEDWKLALSLGIVEGQNKVALAPKALATRAEAAVMIARVLVARGFMNE
ncbi:S-layer homology domain-containing protein [Paenibacillus sp. TAF43_2]|uniref:S-layer homology domain-containing protein n=1 Tax=Paenibacillus sp. TAF43_2 TaxID=3233069 RepID=UPI003F97887E